jgi:hypothetical protein
VNWLIVDSTKSNADLFGTFGLWFGNEFNLTWLETEHERQAFLENVADFYHFAKTLHPDGLVLSNDGLVMKPTDLVSHYGAGLPDIPTVKHEFGNYNCSLPDISLIDRFLGVIEPGARSLVAATRHGRVGVVGTVGTIFLLAGIAMLVLPGPGITATLLGLVILATEFSWAHRLLRRARVWAHQVRVAVQARRARRRQRRGLTPPEGS